MPRTPAPAPVPIRFKARLLRPAEPVDADWMFFVLPAAACAFVLGIASVTVIGPLAAAGDAHWQSERSRINNFGKDNTAQAPVWLREGDDARQMIIRGASQNRANGRTLEKKSEHGRRIPRPEAPDEAARWRLRVDVTTGVRDEG